jgi:tRNA nucleotidyltransferase/poly(A) polymerase
MAPALIALSCTTAVKQGNRERVWTELSKQQLARNEEQILTTLNKSLVICAYYHGLEHKQ